MSAVFAATVRLLFASLAATCNGTTSTFASHLFYVDNYISLSYIMQLNSVCDVMGQLFSRDFSENERTIHSTGISSLEFHTKHLVAAAKRTPRESRDTVSGHGQTICRLHPCVRI